MKKAKKIFQHLLDAEEYKHLYSGSWGWVSVCRVAEEKVFSLNDTLALEEKYLEEDERKHKQKLDMIRIWEEE